MKTWKSKEKEKIRDENKKWEKERRNKMKQEKKSEKITREWNFAKLDLQ
jgi:hypothetical protein